MRKKYTSPPEVTETFLKKRVLMLKAYKRDEFLGFYELRGYKIPFTKRIYAFGSIKSYKHKAGVPRALIKQAVESLQTMADRNNCSVIHRGIFHSGSGNLKLPHIYKEMGYLVTEHKIRTRNRIASRYTIRRTYEPRAEEEIKNQRPEERQDSNPRK